MVQQRDISPASAYIVNKLKLADEKRGNLLDDLNRLSKLSYEKGVREGDSILRKKVKAAIDEIEQYYRTIQAFVSGRGGDTQAFTDMLIFFNESYFENYQLPGLVDQIKQVILQQEKLNQEYEAAHKDKNYTRRINIFAKQLEKDLMDLERMLQQGILPLLSRFIADINDIVLYYQVSDTIGELISSDDFFTQSGAAYQEFKKSFIDFLEVYVKLTRKALSDTDMEEMINRSLQQMGLRSLILKCKNVKPEKYKEILTEIIKSGNFQVQPKKISGDLKENVEPIRAVETKQEEISKSRKTLLGAFEDLCNLENIKDSPHLDSARLVKGLAKNSTERYMFHKPGTFEVSLKFVSEYLRNALIMIIDWLNREIQKTPNYISPLRPVLGCIPSIRQFIAQYKLALDVSADKSNQAVTGLRFAESHYISKRIAKELIRFINDNCNIIEQALLDSLNIVGQNTIERSEVLSKKIKVIRDSFYDSVAKIRKGLSEIDAI
jgi:hypothetical protein